MRSSWKILAGLLRPSAEEEISIKFNKNSIKWNDLKRNINYIPSKPFLFEYISGNDNINYLISLFELNEKRNSIMKNMQELDLISELDREVYTCSLGMKAKLYIGIMIERNTSLILIDEILSNIDIESLKIIVQILKNKIREERCSVLFSSHTPLVEEINDLKKIYIRNRRLEEK